MKKKKAKLDMYQISNGMWRRQKSRQDQVNVELIVDRICTIDVTAIEEKRRQYSHIEIKFADLGINWSGSIFDLALHLQQPQPKTTLF